MLNSFKIWLILTLISWGARWWSSTRLSLSWRWASILWMTGRWTSLKSWWSILSHLLHFGYIISRHIWIYGHTFISLCHAFTSQSSLKLIISECISRNTIIMINIKNNFTYSGSLYNTFNALFKVLKTSYKAFLLSVILAGSPNADERL